MPGSPVAPLKKRILDRRKALASAAPAPSDPTSAPTVAAGADGAQPATAPSGIPGQPAGEPPAEKPPITLLDIIREDRGVDLRSKYRTDEAFIDGALNAMRLVGARDADAEYGRQMRQYDAQFRQFLAQQQPAEPQQSAQQAAGPWNIPQWNPQWSQFLVPVTDPTSGETVGTDFKPGTPQAIRQQIDQYRAARIEFEAGWTQNPAAMIEKFVEPLVQKRVEKLIDERFGAERGQQTAQQIFQSNQEWLVERDEAGRPRTDPFTGQPVLSQRGAVYLDKLQVTTSLTPDPQLAHDLALQLAHGEIALAILRGMQKQPTQGNQPTNGHTAAANGQVPSLPGIPATPAGARHKPNATGGAGPSGPAPMQFPANARLGTRIKEAYRAQRLRG